MKKSKNKTKHNKKSQVSSILHPIVLCSLVITVSIALSIYSILPELKAFREHIATQLITKTIISAVVICFTVFDKSELTKYGKLISMLFASIPWISIIASRQIYLITLTAYFFVIFSYIIIKYLKNLKQFRILNFEAAILGLILASSSTLYTFYDASHGLHFWKISLVIGIIAAIIAFYYAKIDVLELTQSLNLLFTPILICFLFFAITWITAMNLNYALDTYEPIQQIATIIDKDVDTSGKSRDYIFTLDLDGKTIDLNVSSSTYYDYKTGEEFIIEYRRGAFNHPFYIEN